MIVKYKTIFASILFVLMSFECMGQIEPPPPMPPPPPGLPIDGMVVIVLILGLLYGVKKRLECIK
jgi:hypothetical protein